MGRAFRLSTIFDVRGNRLKKEMGGFKRQVLGLEKTTSRLGGVFSGVFGAHATMYGISMLSNGIRTITDDFIALDHQVTAAGAIFGPMYYRGTEGARELTQATREVGEVTEFTAAQSAMGLREYAKAGLDAKQSMSLLSGTAQLATNAEVDFAQAASISLDALDAFNLRSKDTAVTTKNLADVNDTLSRVVTSAKLDFIDFSETMKYSGPVAQQTGGDLRSLATITGLVAKAGIRGSLAGTTLKNTYLGLAAPVGKGAKMLRKLNIEISNNDGTMRDTLDILVDFKAATENMGQAQRLAAINAVFGRRAIAGVSKILSLGTQDLRDYRDQMNDTSGTAKTMADQMRNSIQNRLARIKSAATEVGLKMFDMFGPKIETGIEKMIELLDDGNKNFSEFKELVGDTKDIFVEWSPWIKTVGVGLLTFWGVSKGIVLATKAWAVAQWLLNVAMGANPLGAFILAVAVGTALIYKNKEAVYTWVMESKMWIGSLGDKFVVFGGLMQANVLRPLMLVMETIGKFTGNEWATKQGSILREEIKELEEASLDVHRKKKLEFKGAGVTPEFKRRFSGGRLPVGALPGLPGDKTAPMPEHAFAGAGMLSGIQNRTIRETVEVVEKKTILDFKNMPDWMVVEEKEKPPVKSTKNRRGKML